MMMCLTSESTIFANAAPMITPTARSMTLPFNAKALNSSSIALRWGCGFMEAPCLCGVGGRALLGRDDKEAAARFRYKWLRPRALIPSPLAGEGWERGDHMTPLDLPPPLPAPLPRGERGRIDSARLRGSAGSVT